MMSIILMICAAVCGALTIALAYCNVRLRVNDDTIEHYELLQTAVNKQLRKLRVEHNALLLGYRNQTIELNGLQERIEAKDTALAELRDELEKVSSPQHVWAMIHELQAQAKNSQTLITMLENANTAYAHEVAELKELHRTTSATLAKVAGDDK